MYINADALSKMNDAPQLLPTTVITTNTTTLGALHDLSYCADQIVSVVMTVSAMSGTGSVKLLLNKSDDGATLTTINNDDLRVKDPTTGYYPNPEPSDKAAVAALSGVGTVKLGFVKTAKYFRPSVVSTGITGSVSVSVIVQYEKREQH